MTKREQFFLDTSFFIALLDHQDVHHQRALRIDEHVKKLNGQAFLSDVVLNEVSCVISRKYGDASQNELLKSLFVSLGQSIAVMPILCLYELYNRYFGLVQKMILDSNGTLSVHDGLIVLFLRQVPLVHLVTFDQDFKLVKGLRVLSE